MMDADLVFRAMGDPTRVQILRMLSENGEMCVCKITEELEMTQSSVSHHLSALRNAGLVSVRRKGQWSHYSLRSETVSGVVMAFATELLEKSKKAKNSPPCSEESCSVSGKEIKN